jgi:hypothetical protein
VSAQPQLDMAAQVGGTLRKAEAWAQSELGAQLALSASLESHLAALGRGQATEIETTLAALRGQLGGERLRARQREQWLADLGRLWQVDPRALTVRSVVERAGPEGQRLGRLRGELERTARRVGDLGRRVALIARQQRGIVGELITTLTGADPERPDRCSGTLVDAEA